MTDWFIPRYQMPPPQRTVLVVVRFPDDTKRCLRAMYLAPRSIPCAERLANRRRRLYRGASRLSAGLAGKT